METTLLSLMHGFSVALAFSNLRYAFLGCLVGTLVGVLPGIGPLSGISILLPVTFGIAAVGSWVAGTFGVIVLTVVAPPLATIALKFGPPEYTALLVLGLIFLAYMSSASLVRTLLMASLGLMFGMIGIDNMTGHFRYSFNLAELGDGIGIVPVAVGLFGLGEILSTPSANVVGEVISPKLRELLPNREEWRQAIMPIARGSLLGFII